MTLTSSAPRSKEKTSRFEPVDPGLIELLLAIDGTPFKLDSTTPTFDEYVKSRAKIDEKKKFSSPNRRV